jgi:hypothetical protein
LLDSEKDYPSAKKRFTISNYVNKGSCTPAVSRSQATSDKYADLQRVRNMAIEFSNGCYALDYGTINTCSPDEGENWEETHQKIYYQSVLCLALKLDLYTEVNGQFYLTKWGLRATERRQNMSL